MEGKKTLDSTKQRGSGKRLGGRHIKRWGNNISLDMKNMFSKPIKINEGCTKFDERGWNTKEWKKKEVLHNNNFIWNNTHYINEDKIVKVDNSLGMGSRDQKWAPS